jgi:hypothetical protein
MVFSSQTFICVFLPLTLGIYFLPKSMNNAMLVAASFVFYCATRESVRLRSLIASSGAA